MIALTLESATTVAAVAAGALAIAAVASLWLVHSIVQKIISMVLLGSLAFAVWTQRAALEDCADKVTATVDLLDSVSGDATAQTDSGESGGSVDAVIDNECTIFGVTVTVPVPEVPGG